MTALRGSKAFPESVTERTITGISAKDGYLCPGFVMFVVAVGFSRSGKVAQQSWLSRSIFLA